MMPERRNDSLTDGSDALPDGSAREALADLRAFDPSN